MASYVLDYLQGRGAIFTVIPHLRGSEEDGEIYPAGVSPDEVVTTVVAVGEHGPSLMVIPASRTLDPELMLEAVGDPEARLATERELGRSFPDYDPGALPPLSMLLLAPMYVDPAVAERTEIVFGAGRGDVSVRMATSDLFGTDPVVIVPLTAESRVDVATATG